MSIAISLLSGKGGTGKTTLTLSMADLLTKCGISTLVIDCDFSTNGATFFYESYLQKGMQKKEVYSLSDYIMKNTVISDLKPLNIHDLLDFIPSIPAITNEIISPLKVFHRNNFEDKIYELLFWAKSRYDVILFDCQAGYTEILDILLPLMDADLFVLEADSISASSMRNLYLKIGQYIGKAKVYQVFNKASKEEFEVYSKIEGTFFTNIGTLLFDWKIRQAFSRASVPDLENVSSQYGADLCEICNVLVTEKEYKERIQKFSVHLQYLKTYDEKKQLENELAVLSFSRITNSERVVDKILNVLSVLVAVVIITVFVTKNSFGVAFNISYKLMFSAVLLIIATIIFGTLTILLKDNKRDIRRRYEKELREVDERLNDLMSKDEFISNQKKAM